MTRVQDDVLVDAAAFQGLDGVSDADHELDAGTRQQPRWSCRSLG